MGINKVVLALLFAGVFVGSLAAQRYSQVSMTLLNPYRDHASFAGMDRMLSVNAQMRSQYGGLPGSPKSQYIGVHVPVYIWSGAVGVDVLNESQGNLNFTSLRASYNYVQPALNGLFSVGGRLGLGRTALDGRMIVTPDGDYADGSINHNDPKLGAELYSNVHVDFELSAFYRGRDFQVAATISDPIPITTRLGDAQFQNSMTANVYFQYNLAINRELMVMPTLNVKSDLNYVQTDIGALARWRGNIYGGLSVRGYNSNSLDAMSIILGHKLSEKFSLYYSYDAGLSALKYVNDGSHEIIFKYNVPTSLGTGLPPKVIYNPRFL